MVSASLKVPLRVRITQAERDRCQAAMEKLGVIEFSVYVRWALENSTTQVLGPTPKQEKPKAERRRPPVPTVQSAPKLRVVPTPTTPTLMGIPVYATSPDDPQPAPIDDEDWT